jgi:hypothetical protein
MFWAATGASARHRMSLNVNDDGEAIRQARRYAVGTAVEVWQDATLVARLVPK